MGYQDNRYDLVLGGHDDKGIIWPENIAPFQVCIVSMQMHKSPRIAEVAEEIYKELTAKGIEVLFDERPRVMFSDMDLIGIPHRILIGERGLNNGMLEYKNHRAEKSEDVPQEGFMDAFLAKLGQN